MLLYFNKEKTVLEAKDVLCFTALHSFGSSYPHPKEETSSGESGAKWPGRLPSTPINADTAPNNV